VNATNPELLARGRSAEVFAWGDGKVLKLFYDNCAPDRANSEAKITDSVFRAGLPVPEIFETIEWDNRQGIVFEKIDGISMLDACIKNPQNAEEYGILLANIHRKIHKVAIETLPNLQPLLIQLIRKSVHLSAEQKKKVVSLLENQTNGFQLCHMDFHPDQVLITEKGPHVIDWESGCHGNPLADVARTALILRIGEISRPTSISKQDLDEIRSPIISNYLDQYFSNPSRESSQTMVVWDLVAAIARLAEKIDGEERQLKLIIEKKKETCDEIESQ
jgi:thiamine kinase-like enzyme